jgi:hypothetical protein
MARCERHAAAENRARPCDECEAFDADGDGDIDLAIAMERGTNRLLLNDGRGRFGDASANLPQNKLDSEEIAILDFDRDGLADIAVANEDDLLPELYRNRGAGKFSDESSRIVVRVKANAVVAFDADGDGFTDLFFGGDKVSHLLMGKAEGSFADESAARLPHTYGATQDVAVGDLDGDRDADLVLGNEDRNQIYRNDGKGVFTLAPSENLPRAANPEETRDVELFDADKDGDLDIFFANTQVWNPRAVPQNRLLLNDGKGQFSDATAAWLPQREEPTTTALPIDIDGDGRLDLLTGVRADISGRTADAPVRAFRNRGDRFEEATETLLPPGIVGNAFDIIAADFDGDGKDDIFVAGRAGPDRLLLTRKP